MRFSTGLILLPPNVLVYLPPGNMRQLHFSENVWAIGYQTSKFNEKGKPISEKLISPIRFCDQRAAQRQDQEMRVLYSERFTRGFRLPEGYGIIE